MAWGTEETVGVAKNKRFGTNTRNTELVSFICKYKIENFNDTVLNRVELQPHPSVKNVS